MKPPSVVEEDAPVRSDRGLVAEQEVQNRRASFSRMDALNGLAELHLVTDQYDVSSGSPHCNDVRNGNLTGLVDEEVIEMPVESFMSNSQALPASKGAFRLMFSLFSSLWIKRPS